MAIFPALKTGALAQYGSSREIRYHTEVLRYLDGSEQRIVHRPAELRWQLVYEQLTESEVRMLADFFHVSQGAVGRFQFNDPWTGEVLENCYFDQDEIEFEWVTLDHATTSIAIRKEGTQR